MKTAHVLPGDIANVEGRLNACSCIVARAIERELDLLIGEVIFVGDMALSYDADNKPQWAAEGNAFWARYNWLRAETDRASGADMENYQYFDKSYPLPDDVAAKLRAYDRGDDVEPFSFVIPGVD